MFTSDPDIKLWSPPYSCQSKNHLYLKCTGKNIADSVESLLGAFFMSNNLRLTFELISNISLVPLRQAYLLEQFPNEDLTFTLGEDLNEYKFDMENDRVEDIFRKYFIV